MVARTRLNVGCGEFKAKGWINIDLQENAMVHPDVEADIRSLPYQDGTVEAVYLGHVLEHLEQEDVELALKEVGRVLGDEGRLCVVGPNLDRMVPGSAEHESARVGAMRWDADAHKWDCTATLLLAMCTDAGFSMRQVPITSPLLDEWPVTSRIWWQAALLGGAP